MLLKVNFFINFLLLTGQLIYGQSIYHRGHVQPGKYYTEIPFVYERNKIFITAEVNGVPKKLLFDTGAPCLLFKDSIHNVSYTFLASKTISDVNKNRKKVDLVTVDKIKMGNVSYSGITALYMDALSGLFKCFEMDGIIGSNLFRFGTVMVDWEKQCLILSNSYSDFGVRKKDGVKISVDKVQSSPHIAILVNDKKTKHVLIDTGSGDFLNLNDKTASWLYNKSKLDSLLYTSNGNSSQGAFGTDNSEVGSRIWAIKDINFGQSHCVNNVIRSSHNSSSIGMELLEHGNFIIDYPNKRFFFMPNDKIIQGIENSFGIDLNYMNDTLRVKGLWKESEADLAGVKKGDVVLKIEDLLVNPSNLCDLFMNYIPSLKDKEEVKYQFWNPTSDSTYTVVLKRLY